MNVKHHFIHKLIQDKEINLKFVGHKMNMVDMFTKPPTKETLKYIIQLHIRILYC